MRERAFYLLPRLRHEGTKTRLDPRHTHVFPIPISLLRGFYTRDICTLDLVEDEHHYLTKCPAYEELRQTILSPSSRNLSANRLLQQENPEILARYLRAADELREDKLASYHITRTTLCGMTTNICKRKGGSARGKLLPLQVTDRTKNGLQFKITRQKRKKTIYLTDNDLRQARDHNSTSTE